MSLGNKTTPKGRINVQGSNIDGSGVETVFSDLENERLKVED